MKKVFFIFMLIALGACTYKAAENAKKLNDEGVSFLDREEYEKAANSFRGALSQGNLNADLEAGILRNLSLLFSFQNEKDSARFYAKKAFARTEKGTYYHLLTKAELALLEEDIASAKDNFEKAKALQPDEMAIYNSLGMIYSGKYGNAYQDFNKALENNKKAYEISKREPLVDALATSYMNLEKYKESIPLWESLINENPAKMEYHFQLGVALLFSGKASEGEEKMEYAAARDENCRRMLEEMIAE